MSDKSQLNIIKSLNKESGELADLEDKVSYSIAELSNLIAKFIYDMYTLEGGLEDDYYNTLVKMQQATNIFIPESNRLRNKTKDAIDNYNEENKDFIKLLEKRIEILENCSKENN